MPFLDPDPLTDALRKYLRGKPADPGLPRGVRWAKFLSIIVVAGVLLGTLFAFSIYVAAVVDVVSAFTSRHHSLHGVATEVSRDNPHAFLLRFIVGACIGSALGLIYVIRCLIKRVDP
jgi:hypothetical protein